MKLLAVLALLISTASAPASVSARAYCLGGIFNDVGLDASLTAPVHHDERVSIFAYVDGQRTVLGRQVFVRRGTTFATTVDMGVHQAPSGVKVVWRGFSAQRSIPWTVRWVTPSISCR